MKMTASFGQSSSRTTSSNRESFTSKHTPLTATDYTSMNKPPVAYPAGGNYK